MQNLWRKLTLGWPCILGDWLWANVAMPLFSLPKQITFRRAVFLAAFAVAALAVAQVLTIDLALFMAGDIAFYCEIISVVMLIVVRGHIRHHVQMAKMALKQAMRRAAIYYRRGIGVRRRRGVRKPFSGSAKNDDGEGYPAFAMQAV
jgi:hypothetical protein